LSWEAHLTGRVLAAFFVCAIRNSHHLSRTFNPAVFAQYSRRYDNSNLGSAGPYCLPEKVYAIWMGNKLMLPDRPISALQFYVNMVYNSHFLPKTNFSALVIQADYSFVKITFNVYSFTPFSECTTGPEDFIQSKMTFLIY
jgi:hypothetical protein